MNNDFVEAGILAGSAGRRFFYGLVDSLGNYHLNQYTTNPPDLSTYYVVDIARESSTSEFWDITVGPFTPIASATVMTRANYIAAGTELGATAGQVFGSSSSMYYYGTSGAAHFGWSLDSGPPIFKASPLGWGYSTWVDQYTWARTGTAGSC